MMRCAVVVGTTSDTTNRKQMTTTTHNYSVGAAQCIDVSYSYVIPTSRFFTESDARLWFATVLERGMPRGDAIYYSKRYCTEATYLRVQRRARYACLPSDPLSQREPLLERLRNLALAPSSFKWQRAIGVEVECYGPALGKRLPYWVRETTDGSLSSAPAGLTIRDGREYRILLNRPTLEQRLYQLCQLLANHKVNKTCGLHVHLDMRDRTESEVWTLAKHLDKWLQALRTFVPRSRWANPESGPARFCKFGVSRADRYRAVNFMSYREHKTLEVRMHSGTTDYTKSLSWVRLLELLLVVKAKPKGEGLAALLQLPLCEYERSYWVKRHRELNPEMYNSTEPSTEVE